ncbi:MAG: hypothetical protein IT368_17630, partial [Candidatus Hydrogenedentes bacterium]|nr:hypothetical protein [Candidatus Hydrogenedentota bacterium]
SKRGWTTWLTAASDPRVRAIIPIVIDVLNMDEQVAHHRKVYGYWSPAIYEYAQEEVFERIETPGGQALLVQVDPFEYRENLTMPKLIINSTGDQFFPPDSSQFYFDEMPGENYLNYAPNSDHGINNGTDFFDDTSAINSLQAFSLAALQDVDLPEFSWTFEDNGSIVVQTQDTPLEVNLWQATNPDGRDFRLDRVGEIWTSTPLASSGGGRYVAQVGEPDQGWRGFFVQLRFDNPATLALPFVPSPDFIFTTPVRVIPDTYPTFEGERFSVGSGSAPVTVVKLWGTPEKMGMDYGTLMQSELQTFIPQFLSSSEAANPALTPAALDAAWTTVLPYMDQRIVTELQAIADASGLSRVQLQRANMIPVLEPTMGAAALAWDEATADRDVLSAQAVDYPLNRGLQDYRQLTLYIPDDGVPHTTIGFTGLIMPPAGINLGGITTAAVGDANPVAPAASSHFLPMFREILYEGRSLRGALDIVDNTPLVQDHRFLFGDGRNEMRGAKVRVLPPDQDVWFEDDPTDEVAPNVAPGLLYVDPDDSIYTKLDDDYGVLNETIMRAIAGSEGAADSNIMNVVTHGFTLDISVSYANGTSPASAQPYATFNMQEEMP